MSLTPELEHKFMDVLASLHCHRTGKCAGVAAERLAEESLSRIRKALEEAQARIKELEEKEEMAWNSAVEASERD